jgi:hypothetical protein
MQHLFNSPTVWGILIRFLITLVFLFVLIAVIYFRYSKKEKFLFTFFLIGIYDDVELLKPGNRHKLIKDLSSRTGQVILRIKILKVDLKMETAELEIFFRA